MTKNFAIILAFFFTTSLFGATEKESGKKYRNPISKLSFDSGYLQDSARAFWNFGQDVDGIVSVGFDAINSTIVGEYMIPRLLLAGGFYWQWNRLQYGFFVSNHELGHGARIRAIGGNPIYRWGTESWQEDIFSFWSKGFTRYGHGAEAATGTNVTSQYIPSEYQFIIISGGMNNSAQYAEFIEDQITFGGGGHILQYPGYVRAKQDAAAYVDNTQGGQSGDVANAFNIYAAKGYNISAAELKQGSLVSRWASSTHWLFVFSAAKFILSRDPSVNPYFFNQIRVPDISHFLTSRGLSYKVRSGIKNGDTFFPTSLEYVYKGEQTLEASLGMRRSPNVNGPIYGVDLSLNSVGGFGISADSSILRTPSLSLNLGASFYSEASLLGERVIGKYLPGGTKGYEVWAKLVLDY